MGLFSDAVPGSSTRTWARLTRLVRSLRCEIPALRRRTNSVPPAFPDSSKTRQNPLGTELDGGAPGESEIDRVPGPGRERRDTSGGSWPIVDEPGRVACSIECRV